MSRRSWWLVARSLAMAYLLLLVASLFGCGREDVPLDPDDDGGEDAEAPGDGGAASARPSNLR